MTSDDRLKEERWSRGRDGVCYHSLQRPTEARVARDNYHLTNCIYCLLHKQSCLKPQIAQEGGQGYTIVGLQDAPKAQSEGGRAIERSRIARSTRLTQYSVDTRIKPIIRS